MRQEMAQAKLVLYGTVGNSRYGEQGTSTTDFKILKVLKSDPALGGRALLTLNRYVPILNPKDAPKYVLFCNVNEGKILDYLGRAVPSEAAVAYLEGAKALEGKDRVESLLYFFRYLDHAEEVLANDAFLEFARASDQEVAAVAHKLPADKLRQLLQNPKTPASRLGLYAFLLGVSGQDRDAELLHGMIVRPTERTSGALDGLLCGYISLRPAAGWDLLVAVLKDQQRPFTQRLTASRALRFYHGWKPDESRKQVLCGLSVMVQDADLADLAIGDLRKWKMWDLTDTVLGLYGTKSHDSPITLRAIALYALSCPLPEAGRFVQQLRRQDASLVAELEESLAGEKQR
jgi:hypothetical protein